MSDDQMIEICGRDKSGIDWTNQDKPIVTMFSKCCNPKDHEKLYCESCEKEVFEETNSLCSLNPGKFHKELL